jgi:hypothetical protein
MYSAILFLRTPVPGVSGGWRRRRQAVLVEELGAEEVERLKWEQLKADADEEAVDSDGEQALGFQLSDDDWGENDEDFEVKEKRSIPSEVRMPPCRPPREGSHT